MSSLITRRKILQGMFAMPAIVAVGNIMPISVIESWDLDRPTEDWVLVADYRNTVNMSWIRASDYMVYDNRDKMIEVREAKIHPSMNSKTMWVDTVKQLNAIQKGNVVTERLPSTMMTFESTRKGILMPENKPQIIPPKSLFI
jgi:hypothetical protein